MVAIETGIAPRHLLEEPVVFEEILDLLAERAQRRETDEKIAEIRQRMAD